MANLNTALTADNLTHIRAGGFRFKAYLSVVPETTVATARINQASFSATQAELTVDTTSGWADVEPGMTVKIGTSAGAGDVYVGRVRATPGATTLYISEFSNGDPGLNTTTTTTALADNQYVTITSSYNSFSVFPRLYYDGTNYTLYKDYNVAYDQQTGSKKPAIVNIGDHVAGFVDSTTTVLTDSRTANVSVFGAETVSSYAWDIADGTLTSGTLSSQSITATYPAGNRWVTCTVTLSNSQTVTVRRFIAAHDTGSNAPLEVIPSTTRKSRANSSVAMELVSTFTSGLKNNSMAIFWLDASWGGQTVASASTQFVGWVQDLQESIQDVSTLSFSLVNALSILGKTKAFAQRLEYNASPTDWIYSDVAHVDFAAFYILRFHTTLLDLFDFTGTGLTSYTAEAWRVEEGNFIGQVNRILECVNAEITQVSSGAIYLRRNPAMMGTTPRASVVDRMTITADDVAEEGGIDYTFNVRNSVGKVQGNAFSTGTSTPTPYRADGYGTVSGQGTGTVTLNDQRVANQAELNDRVSNKLALENNPYPAISLTFLTGGYDVIEPALWYFTTLSIASSYAPDGTALTFRCIPQDVSISYGENGVQTVTVTLSAETNGLATPGETVAIPVSPISYDAYGLPILDFDSSLGWGLGLPSYLGMSPLPPAPVDDADIAANATTRAVAWNNTLTVTQNFTVASPDWTDIVLTGNVRCVLRMNSTRVIVVTASKLYDVADMDSTPAATDKASITGYTLARKTKTAGEFVVYGQEITSGAWSKVFDFTGSQTQSWTAGNPGGGPWGVIGANGWAASDSNDGVSDKRRAQIASPYFEKSSLTGMSMTYDLVSPDTANDGLDFRYNNDPTDASFTTIASTAAPTAGTSQTYSASVSSSDVHRVVSEVIVDDNLVTAPNSGSGGIRDTTISGTDFNPFADLAKVKVYDSYGTLVDTLTVGYASPDDSGMDVDDFNLYIIIAATSRRLYLHKGTASYADGTFTEIPNTQVGQFYSSNNIKAVRVPYRKLDNSGVNNDATALHFVFGATTNATSQTVWKCIVNANTLAAPIITNITPVISATTYYPIGPDALEVDGRDGRIIHMLGKPLAGGNTHLLRTTNGGTSWVDLGAYDMSYIRIEEPQVGGNGKNVWYSGPAGIDRSTDRGATVTAKDGDFATETGSAIAAGAFRL